MPMKSERQMRYMFAKHPEMAKEMMKKTPSAKALPERAKGQREAIRKMLKK